MGPPTSTLSQYTGRMDPPTPTSTLSQYTGRMDPPTSTLSRYTGRMGRAPPTSTSMSHYTDSYWTDRLVEEAINNDKAKCEK